MLKNLFLSSVMALTLNVAIGLAQQAPAPDSQTQGLAASTDDVMGTISKVDAAANSLTIKQADNKEKTYKLDSAATITVDGKAASISELKAGQKATLQVDSDKATSIFATSASSSS